MEKQEYNPDKDYGGHSRADYFIRKHSSIENAPKLINKRESPLEILSQTNPKQLVNFGSGRVFDPVFRKLKKAGYEIKDTSRMDGPQKWGYYISLMKEFDLIGN